MLENDEIPFHSELEKNRIWNLDQKMKDRRFWYLTLVSYWAACCSQQLNILHELLKLLYKETERLDTERS